MGNEPTIPARQQATAEPAAVHGRADTHDFAGADDAEIRLMQDGVRDWVQHTVRRGKDGLRTASPAILLSALCASAFCPLLMVGGVAGAGLAVLSSVGGGFLTQVLTDALSRLRERIAGQAPSPEDVQKGIAEQIERVLAAGDEHSASVRNDIASALKEIDAGGTALRAAMEQSNELVRSDVINAIGVLCSDFGELGFLIKDVGQAAADIQRSLDVQGADVQATRGGLMVVTGASGAGKSSLLRAGLLPILARGQQVQGIRPVAPHCHDAHQRPVNRTGCPPGGGRRQ